jgi:hypothetical protein
MGEIILHCLDSYRPHERAQKNTTQVPDFWQLVNPNDWFSIQIPNFKKNPKLLDSQSSFNNANFQSERRLSTQLDLLVNVYAHTV